MNNTWRFFPLAGVRGPVRFGQTWAWSLYITSAGGAAGGAAASGAACGAALGAAVGSLRETRSIRTHQNGLFLENIFDNYWTIPPQKAEEEASGEYSERSVYMPYLNTAYGQSAHQESANQESLTPNFWGFPHGPRNSLENMWSRLRWLQSAGPRTNTRGCVGRARMGTALILWFVDLDGSFKGRLMKQVWSKISPEPRAQPRAPKSKIGPEPRA